MKEEELLLAIKRIIHQHTGDKVEIVLFGSRATGTAVATSDYDIGIKSARPIAALALARINYEIEELPTLRKIDIVDLSRVAPRFYQTALEQTKQI